MHRWLQICLPCLLFRKPIPLECLGLGSFKDEQVSRREENGTSRLLSITKPSHPVFPFTIFHRLDVKRRYTFYVERENLRTRWHEMLVDTLAVRQTERDVNRWYVPEVVDNVTFVSRTPGVPGDSTAHFTGRIAASRYLWWVHINVLSIRIFHSSLTWTHRKLNWARLTL